MNHKVKEGSGSRCVKKTEAGKKESWWRCVNKKEGGREGDIEERDK